MLDYKHFFFLLWIKVGTLGLKIDLRLNKSHMAT